VSNDNAAAARELDRRHWLRGAPEEAATFEYSEQELGGVCPACSARIPEGSTECAECGLVVNPEANMARCPDCDAIVGDEVSRCPNCGIEFE
jgi:hypothetical protein